MKSEEAVDTAKKLLQTSNMVSAWVRKNGKVGTAIPIASPRGTIQSWFVPLIMKDRLLGFFTLGCDSQSHRYSSFQRHDGQLDACPPVADWTHPSTISQRAKKLQRSGETAGAPYLSYDTIPSRLAWAVPFTSPAGRQRIVFVAGEAVFEGSSRGKFTAGTP